MVNVHLVVNPPPLSVFHYSREFVSNSFNDDLTRKTFYHCALRLSLISADKTAPYRRHSQGEIFQIHLSVRMPGCHVQLAEVYMYVYVAVY